MNRKLPPNLYQRQYKTRGGYKRTLWYPRFKCWDGVRRTFPGVDSFTEACAELARLKALDRTRHDFTATAPAPPVNQTLFIWIDKFLEIKSAKASAAADRTRGQWLKGFFGDCSLDEIVHSRMLEYRKSRAVSGTTKNRELALLRGVLYLAHHDGQLEKMPKIPFEEENNERTRTASAEELQAILATIRPDARDVIALLIETGFRLGEVLRITPGDLNFFTQSVNMKKVRSKGGLKRPLPMSPAAWKILEARAAGKQASDRLFQTTRWTVYRHFVDACRGNNIEGLTVHDLRGTFVTEKERQRWPRKAIREFTGHHDEAVFDRYSRATDADLRALIGATRQRSGNKSRFSGVSRGK